MFAMLSLPLLVTFASVCLVCLVSTYFVRRYLRLRHVPGPLLASLTDFWLAYKYRNGVHYEDLIKELHDQYGPVVRFGPTRVSFASPDSIQEIYVTKNVLPKADSYGPMTVVANGKEVSSLITLRDEYRVAMIKRHVSAGFSQAGFLKQEPQINGVLTQFLELVKASENDEYVHLSQMLRWWTFDTINRIAFSDDLGYMAAGADAAHVFKGVQQRFAHWKMWYALPYLEWLLFKSPPALLMQKKGSTNILANIAMKRVQQRKTDDEKSLESDLLGRFLAASRNDPRNISRMDVVALTLTTVNAGADTVAITTILVLINLLRNPKTLSRLEEEILPLNLPTPPQYDQIASLPYLDACIRESMRVAPISDSSFERRVPRRGRILCGVWIPGGTTVSSSVPHCHNAVEIFGEDSNLFRPERWVECDRQAWLEMEKHSLGFSQGRRVCTGQSLARIEMKKVLASLITPWKIELAEEPRVGWDTFIRAADLKVRLQRR